MKRAALVASLMMALSLQAKSQGFLGTLDAAVCGGRIGHAGNLVPDKVAQDLRTFSLEQCDGIRPFSPDAAFCDYLLRSELFDDAQTLLFPGAYAPSDTLSFYRGMLLYRRHGFGQSAGFFGAINPGSAYYEEGFFRGVEAMLIAGDSDACRARLDSYEGRWTSLKTLEEAALHLYEGDAAACCKSLSEVQPQHFSIDEAAGRLSELAASRQQFKARSPLVGAVASALVPGLGKVYAGRVGEGVASLLTVGALGAITAENWIKRGPTNWKTILFGSLGTLFYISGIHGSWVSVGLYNEAYESNYETAVVATLHLPISVLFD